ncbi:MAG: c-type cytochrome [Planctomycetaceae bacterium]|jgi:YVTN family beta-propeller protein|nr:c-type cytochrome [Planctomycetaceae bacterium]
MKNIKILITNFIVGHFLTFVVGVVIGGGFILLLLRDNWIDKDSPSFNNVSPSFNSADRNNDGVVNKNEFRKILVQQARINNQKLKKITSTETPYYSAPPVSFDNADKNNDGQVDKNEFQQALTANYRNEKSTLNFFPNSQNNNQHDDCPIKDMPADVKPNSGFVWQGGNKSAISKSPNSIAASRDGSTLFVSLRDINSVGVLDTSQNKFIRFIPVGNSPNAIEISKDEKNLYVINGEYNGQIQIVDIESGKILKESKTGHTPTGITITPDEQRVFVCNRFNADVCEFALPTLSLLRKIKTIREPTAIVASNDGKRIFVTNSQPDDINNYPENPEKIPDAAAEITVINSTNGIAENIRLPKGSCNVNGICISQNEEYIYLTHLISHYWNNTDKLDRGQMNVNAMSIINLKNFTEKNNQLITTITLDDPELGAANPYAITANSQQIFITTAGTDELITIDLNKLHSKINQSKISDLSTDFTFLDGMKKRIKLSGKGARSIKIVDQSVFVGLYFNDSIQRVDFHDNGEIILSEIPIGQRSELSQERAGEMYWNDATLCYQQWQSCASCHPDARMTAMNWDLLHDGADNPKNTKSLILSHQTPPTMWLGDRRHAMQCTRTGFRFIMFSTPLREPCFAIDEYTKTLKPTPSPHLIDGKLSEKAERGKKLFNDPNVGCVSCHSGQYFTDLKMYDVGSEDQFCNQKLFDTPTLIETWRTAPYLHDGRYKNMKDVFKIGKHGKENGNIEQLTDSQLDDLVEYVLSL